MFGLSLHCNLHLVLKLSNVRCCTKSGFREPCVIIHLRKKESLFPTHLELSGLVLRFPNVCQSALEQKMWSLQHWPPFCIRRTTQHRSKLAFPLFDTGEKNATLTPWTCVVHPARNNTTEGREFT